MQAVKCAIPGCPDDAAVVRLVWVGGELIPLRLCRFHDAQDWADR